MIVVVAKGLRYTVCKKWDLCNESSFSFAVYSVLYFLAPKNSKNHAVKFKPEKSNGSAKKKNKQAETFDFSLSPTLFDINLSVKKVRL